MRFNRRREKQNLGTNWTPPIYLNVKFLKIALLSIELWLLLSHDFFNFYIIKVIDFPGDQHVHSKTE